MLTSSCATTEQAAKPIFTAPTKASEYKLKKELKVGLISILGPNVTHFHSGVTVFNNFEKQYDVDWDVTPYINMKLKNDLENMGYKYQAITTQMLLF